MNNFYIVTNVTKDKSLETTDYIEKYLTEHGRHVTVMAVSYTHLTLPTNREV